MWHLIEDFFEQSIVMQAVIAWGWLSIIIMIASIVQGTPALIGGGE